MIRMLAGVAVAGLVQATLFAQIAAPPPGMGRPAPQPITKTEMQAMVAQQFAAFDLNHDGKVTREEVDAFRRAKFEEMRKDHKDREFARLDSNHDGSISKAEFDVPRMPGPGGPDGPPPRSEGGRGGPPMGGKGPIGGPGMMMLMGGGWFDRADANHDGAVTLAEAQTAAATLFDRIDTNHDGTISPDEMRAVLGRGGRGGWDRRGRGGPGGPGFDRPGGPGDMPPPPPPQG